MLKRMTYKTLIRKCEEGEMQVEQWDVRAGLALVSTVSKVTGRVTKHTVQVTGIPANIKN